MAKNLREQNSSVGYILTASMPEQTKTKNTSHPLINTVENTMIVMILCMDPATLWLQ